MVGQRLRFLAGFVSFPPAPNRPSPDDLTDAITVVHPIDGDRFSLCDFVDTGGLASG